MWSRAAAAVACAALAGCGRPAPGVAQPGRTNLLLVTLDTFRADRLGHGFTPTLDALAARGLRFSQARSAVPLTLPAHVSIMTGEWPPSHGVRLNGAARLDGHPTLASRLKAAGYQTRAVVGAFVLDRRFGLDVGFDEYDDAIARDPDATDRLQADRPANKVTDRAVAMLGRTSTDRPWFVWVHFYDPHAPYEPPADARSRARGDAYDGEIAFVDAELGRLLATVGARPDAGRTAIIALGDHGESLGEHGEPTHGMLVFDPALRVPMLVSGPGVPAAERSDPSSIVDVLPTALAITGQTPGEGPGRNRLTPSPADRETYAETQYPSVAGWTPLRALVQDRWKLIVADRPALYDLTTDPAERHDLAASRTTLAQAMAARVEVLGRPAQGAAPADVRSVPADTAERLRSLGYVAASAAPAVTASGVDPASVMDAWAGFEHALSAMNSGQSAQVVGELARIAAAYLDAPIFQSTYARALSQSGRKQDALVKFREAVKRWPADAMLYHELAVVAREVGLSAEASRAEAAALTLNSAEPAVHNGRGLLLADAGEHAEAARAFGEAVRLDPTNGVYHANLGNARRAGGDLTGAAEAYRRALELAPRLPDAANGLGVVLVQQRQTAEAVKWLELAASDSSFVEAQLNLGIALQETGDIERAKAQYQRVLSAAGRHVREREAARALLKQLDRR